MKIIHLIFLLGFLPAAKGQGIDFCKQIVKDTAPDKSTFNFSSPFDPVEKPALRITRSYTNDKEYPFDNFIIVLQVYGELESIYHVLPTGEKEEKSEKGLVIQFEDKSKITDDSMVVNHDFSIDKTESLRYVYYTVTDENYKDFSTKRIEKISLAGYEQVVPVDSTNAFQKYLQCLKAVR